MPKYETHPLFPEVLAAHLDQHGIRLDLRIAENLACFVGHFPGVPVVPGVVQIHWAVHFGRTWFPELRRFHHMEVVKFMDLMTPGNCPSLHLDFDALQQRLKFAYRSIGRKYSSGRIYFHE